MKTSELTGKALDWAVALAEGATGLAYDGVACYWFTLNGVDRVLSRGWSDKQNWHPSTNWSQGGPIIEREKICADFLLNDRWLAVSRLTEKQGYGPAPLIAAMRCYVASKLGNEVNIPENLK